jgi:hypothetical protein
LVSISPTEASSIVASTRTRLVVVDAIDEQAASFYQRHGFIPTPDHPLRLYRRMSDILASLDQT